MAGKQGSDTDFHEIRNLSHRRKLGIRTNILDEICETDSAENRLKLVQHVKNNFKIKDCLRFVPNQGDSCFCGELRHFHSQEVVAAPTTDYIAQSCQDSSADGLELQNLITQEPEIRSYTIARSLAVHLEAPPSYSETCLPSRRPIQAKKTAELGLVPPEDETKDWQENQSIIERLPTNAFGKVEFANDESGAPPAKFVRLSDSTPVSTVFDLLKNHWSLCEPRPSLVISVNGGAKHFRFPEKTEKIFSQGLLKAAYATDAWILTWGYNVGVQKAVGHAVHDGKVGNKLARNIKCIGIGAWGYVLNREDLVNTDGNGSWPATYHVDPVIRPGPVPLNPDHTHFILVDNGYRNSFPRSMPDYRARLERHIAMGDENEPGIPLVVVLVEGGLEAITAAHESLKHKIPLVICEGTGRAADILAYAFKHHLADLEQVSTEQRRVMLPSDRLELAEMLRNAYPEAYATATNESSMIEEKLQQISACCQHENLITVFDVHKSHDFDLAILSALMKDEDKRTIDDVKLSLKWNRQDMAEIALDEAQDWDWAELDQLMTEALIENKPKFVKLFLQHGVVMKDYLTVERLRVLYNAAEQGSHMRRLLAKHCSSPKLYLSDVRKLLQTLLHQVDPTYALDTPDTHNWSHRFPRPFKELLIWSILLNRIELAKLFWERSENPTMNALVASNLYRILRHKSGGNEALKHEYRELQSEFEQLAICVVNEAFNADPAKTLLVIERPHRLWGGLSCLEMASDSFDRHFMATKCAQASVRQTFKRGLRCAFLEVLFGLLCPLFVIFKLKFDKGIVGSAKLGVCQKLKIFYFAPVTKFCISLISHLIFLCIYTYVVLFNMRTRFTELEIVLHVWVLSLALCEVLQLFERAAIYDARVQGPDQKFVYKWRPSILWKGYWKSHFWTKLTSGAIFFHTVACVTRFFNDSGQVTMDWTRVILSLSMALFYFKLFRFYMASSYLGPKLYIIRKMFRDVFMFMTILLLIMLAYATAIQTLLYPVRPFYWKFFADLLYFPYWQLYGELALDETVDATKEGCMPGNVTNSDGEFCPRKFWPITFMVAGYVLVGNIILVNLLIAIFTYVFDEVQHISTEIWKFEMWTIACEFDALPVLPAPLNLVETVYRILSFLLCAGKNIQKSHEDFLTDRQVESLKIFEKQCMADFCRSLERDESLENDLKMQQLQNQLDEITAKLDEQAVRRNYSQSTRQ